ncbi:MAG: hypothetical protein U1D55_18635 [Phycisphaerae bacterium]
MLSFPVAGFSAWSGAAREAALAFASTGGVFGTVSVVNDYRVSRVSAAVGVPVFVPTFDLYGDYAGCLHEMTFIEGGAADVLRAAVAASVEYTGDDHTLECAASGDLDAIDDPQIQAWLADNAAAIALLPAAVDLPYAGIYELPEGKPLYLLEESHLGPLRRLAQGNVMIGRRMAARGQLEPAIDRYLDTTKLGSQIGEGLLMIDHLVGCATQKAGADAILDAFAGDTRMNFALLAEQARSRFPPLAPMSIPLQYGRMIALDLLQRTYTYCEEYGLYILDPFVVKDCFDESSASQTCSGIGIWLSASGLEEQVARVNAVYDELTCAVMVPYQLGQSNLRDLDRRVHEDTFKTRYPLLVLFYTKYHFWHSLATANEARRRAVLLVAEIKAFEQREGRLPESIEALHVGSIAIDPFDARLMRYRRIDQDFTLYSVGENGTDEGGVAGDHLDENDLVFWPRPAR